MLTKYLYAVLLKHNQPLGHEILRFFLKINIYVLECGTVNRKIRIVGGQETEVNEYPWQVGISSATSSTNFFCGGSIVSDKWVLTAAHCIDG